MSTGRRWFRWLALSVAVVAVLAALGWWLQERSIRDIEKLRYQQQVQRDEYLAQGHRRSSVDGSRVPYSADQWRDDYDRSMIEAVARRKFRERVMPSKPGWAKTDNEKALAGYYELQDKFYNPKDGIFEVEQAMEAIDEYERGLPPDQAYYFQRNINVNRTPMVEEYLVAKRALRPYWDIYDRSVSVRLPTGEIASELINEINLKLAEAKAKVNTEAGRLADAQAKKMLANLDLRVLKRQVDYEERLYRLEHPDIDILLQRWYGYAAVKPFVSLKSAPKGAPKLVTER